VPAYCSRPRLDQIRLQLLRQEDSIIFGWVKRAAYKRNDAAYSAEGLAACLPNEASRRGARSLLDWHLEETEVRRCAQRLRHAEPSRRTSQLLHARIRRYTSPDEHAFFPASLPPPLLPPLTYAYSNPLPRYADEINCNGRVMEAYLRAVLPAITEDGDDNNYGSTVLNDVAALQALSKRIHFGKFVAESKWRAQPELFHDAVRAGDGAAVLAALTYPEQEAAVAARVARKAAGFMASIEEAAAWGEVVLPHQPPCLVTPATVSRLWTELVMPLTKEVQVAYLLRRLEATQAPGAAAGTFVEGQARGRGPIGGFM